jgi:hypothetical protein
MNAGFLEKWGKADRDISRGTQKGGYIESSPDPFGLFETKYSHFAIAITKEYYDGRGVSRTLRPCVILLSFSIDTLERWY